MDFKSDIGYYIKGCNPDKYSCKVILIFLDLNWIFLNDNYVTNLKFKSFFLDFSQRCITLRNVVVMCALRIQFIKLVLQNASFYDFGKQNCKNQVLQS